MDEALCSICHVAQVKYKCPACSLKTCSLECVRRHKKQFECLGLAPATKFVTRNELAQDTNHINRDYNFLMNVDRHIQLGKSDVRSGAKNVFRKGRSQGGGPNKRQKEDKRLKLVESIFGENANSTIKRENTLVVQVPVGMHRSNTNKTGYDKKSGTFVWSVEWVLLGDDKKELARFLSYKLKETLTVKDAVPLTILKNSLGESVDKEKLHFYLSNVCARGVSAISIPGEMSITQALKDKIIVEFPTIYVSTSEDTLKDDLVATYEIEESEFESSSSESDSESDSDSDSEPEESSSKEIKEVNVAILEDTSQQVAKTEELLDTSTKDKEPVLKQSEPMLEIAKETTPSIVESNKKDSEQDHNHNQTQENLDAPKV